jgi:Cu-processing system permease protein
MFARVAVVALSTFREAVRARILLGLAALALATALYSIAVGEFSLRAASRVVADLGAASISLYAVIIAVVLGATSLHRELEQKTLFPILVRPILRAEYLVGKFFGMVLTLAVFIAFEAASILFILARHGGRSFSLITGAALAITVLAVLGSWRFVRLRTYGAVLWAAIALAAGAILASGAGDDRRVVLAASALSLFEIMIVSSIATLFSSFSSPFLTAVLTLGLFIVGREADTLSRLPARLFGRVLTRVGAFLSQVLPNLQVYTPLRSVLTGEDPRTPIGPYLLLAFLQSLGWTVALLVAAHWIFRKRDLV